MPNIIDFNKLSKAAKSEKVVSNSVNAVLITVWVFTVAMVGLSLCLFFTSPPHTHDEPTTPAQVLEEVKALSDKIDSLELKK